MFGKNRTEPQTTLDNNSQITSCETDRNENVGNLNRKNHGPETVPEMRVLQQWAASNPRKTAESRLQCCIEFKFFRFILPDCLLFRQDNIKHFDNRLSVITIILFFTIFEKYLIYKMY